MSPSRNADTIVIIGAGIIGIACAHYLSKDGYRVKVIDKGAIANGCSLGNCGHIIPSHILPLTAPGAIKTALLSLFDKTAPFRIKPNLAPSFLYWMWRFSKRCNERQMLESAAHIKPILDSSFTEYEALLAENSFDCGWRKSGLVYVFQTRRARDQFANTDDLLTQRFGVSAQAIAGRDLTAFDPALRSDLAGGFFYEDDALLHPEKLALGWGRQLKKSGVEFIPNCDFQSFKKSGARICAVQTSKGEIEADQVVLAAGAFSGQIAREFQCNLPVLPGKGYSITIVRPTICPKTSIVLPEQHVAVTPFEDGLRLGSMMEFVGFDDSIASFRTQQLRQSVLPYLNSRLPQADKQVWFGWRPMTWDSLPIIGRAPAISNAFIATGHNMIGVMSAPTTGRLIADIVSERCPHIPDAPYSPKRFYS